MMGNEVKVKVDKLAKFISTKYFNKLTFLFLQNKNSTNSASEEIRRTFYQKSTMQTLQQVLNTLQNLRSESARNRDVIFGEYIRGDGREHKGVWVAHSDVWSNTMLQVTSQGCDVRIANDGCDVSQVVRLGLQVGIFSIQRSFQCLFSRLKVHTMKHNRQNLTKMERSFWQAAQYE
jgi:hypothetical protein